MNFTFYKSIFLTIIIFSKLIVLDSNIIGELMNTDEISYVKQQCKLNSNKSGDGKFSQAPDGLQITFHLLCNSVFQVEEQYDEKEVVTLYYKSNFRQIFAETKAFNYKFVPPPKLS